MDQRFSLKDFLFFTALAGVFVVVLLAMYQVDRQWQKLSQIEHIMTEQAGDIRQLRDAVKSLDRRIGQGIVPVDGSTDLQEEIPPAFRRALAATKKPDYASGDWWVSAFGVNLQTITPLVSSDAYAADVQSYVLETLLTRDPDTLEWLGLIARSWQISDDGLTITFELRDDVTFSDGKPVEAKDVVFSFEFIMNDKIAAPRQRAYYEKIAQVEALSPHTVQFTYKEPYFNALALAGGLEILPKHFYEPYLEKPEQFNQSKGLLLGSGPYQLRDPKSWSPDKGIVELQRNPRYWAPVQPPFDRLVWKVIQNDSARLTTYRNGEIDSYGARPIEYERLLKDQALMDKSTHWEYMSPTAGYAYIAWNQRKEDRPTRFADRRVREAMTFLTDRKRIVDEIYLGYAEIAISPFNPRSRQHAPELQPRGYDPEKALALLKQAGYQDRNGDHILENEAGEKFEFELTYFQDNEDTKRMVLLLKDLYARAGIRLIPKPTEWAVMLDMLKKKTFDAITLGWTSGIETDIYQMFHSSQTVSGGDNFMNYANPELDRLIDQARATVDESQRMPLWQECERILYRDQPYTFLTRRKSLLFIDKRIHNIQQTRIGLNVGIVPIEIYVPAPLQKYRQ